MARCVCVCVCVCVCLYKGIYHLLYSCRDIHTWLLFIVSFYWFVVFSFNPLLTCWADLGINPIFMVTSSLVSTTVLKGAAKQSRLLYLFINRACCQRSRHCVAVLAFSEMSSVQTFLCFEDESYGLWGGCNQWLKWWSSCERSCFFYTELLLESAALLDFMELYHAV